MSAPAAPECAQTVDSFGFPSAPTPVQQRRFANASYVCAGQWKSFTQASALQASPEQLLELAVSHGIHADFRAPLWARASSAVLRAQGSAALDYAACVHQAAGIDAEVGQQIELDLNRTFAEQRDFASALSARAAEGEAFDGSRSSAYDSAAAASSQGCGAAGSGDVHSALRRLLRLFVARNPAIGYLQSMNFLAGFLLLVFGREREGLAFQALEALVLHVLEGYYTREMGMLRVDCRLISALIAQRLPRLAAHAAGTLGFPDLAGLCLPRWLLCVCLNAFPSDITVRIWDVLFMEALCQAEGGSRGAGAALLQQLPPPAPGPRLLAEVCLSIFHICQDELLAADNFPDAVEVLKDVGSRVRDAAELMLLTRHPLASLQGAPMAEWRQRHAPELLAAVYTSGELTWCPPGYTCNPSASGSAAGAAAAAAAPPTPSAAATAAAAAAASSLASPLRSGAGRGARGTPGGTPPPVPIGDSLERLFPSNPLSPAALAAATAAASARKMKSPLALSALRSPAAISAAAAAAASAAAASAASAASAAASSLTTMATAFSASAAVDFAAIASSLNPTLASARKRTRSAAAAVPAAHPPQAAKDGSTGGLAAFALAFSAAARTAAGKVASDASSAASRLAAWGGQAAAGAQPYPTSYSELSGEEAPAGLPLSPVPLVEQSKRLRYGEQRAHSSSSASASGQAVGMVALLPVGPVQLQLLSPPRPGKRVAVAQGAARRVATTGGEGV